ncbi:hypothetical protein LTR78_005990 [Recurvomyces mirabilis]|uniref:Uncharacterized protein n=1 Tax=Recurvomyces mirabilis TaxID=574656 RepID=A0AAE0WLY3_9PEZI|nr:hypothetical protein LTR78_005990 [Recurvomyces mirabilis]KAK5155199.1 hypothetical protein LTS14_006154 [Recurvomyces mirabilis]
MARKRSTSSGPGANPTSPKRQHRNDDDADHDPSTRRPSGTSRKAFATTSTRGRANSPSKNVTFPRNLEQGRTQSIADHRHRSPVRSALRQKEDEEVFSAEEEGYNDSATEESAFDEDLVCSQADPSSQLIGDSPPMVESYSSKLDMADKYGDVHICQELQWLQWKIHKLLKQFSPSFEAHGKDAADDLFASGNRPFLQYVGRLALGGPDDQKSWSRMLEDDSCRRSLAWAVIGQVLKEQCFDVLWFGASPDEERKLREYERSAVDKDGFRRANNRASICRKFPKTHASSEHAGSDTYTIATVKLAMHLERMVAPLYHSAMGTSAAPTRIHFKDIASSAASISRILRLQSDVVYYWPPTFKDEEVEPARMECLNMTDMLEHSPYVKQDAGHGHPVLSEDRRADSQAIVQIVCFPGLVAYRKGGGGLAKHTLAREGRRPSTAPPDVQRVQQMRDGQYTGQEGIRTKTILKAAVHLKWGKQRLLTREAGTSAFLDAVRDGSSKYVDDSKGFREFWDLYGDYVEDNDPKALAAARAHERLVNFDGMTPVKSKRRV